MARRWARAAALAAVLAAVVAVAAASVSVRLGAPGPPRLADCSPPAALERRRRARARADGSPRRTQAPAGADKWRHATNAALALASRLIADPRPVKDAAQAEELAHILKTVCTQPRQRLCVAQPQYGWLAVGMCSCACNGAARPIDAPRPPHGTRRRLTRVLAPRCTGRTALRCGRCPRRGSSRCRSSSSPGLQTASFATWSTSSPAACGRSGSTNVRRSAAVASAQPLRALTYECAHTASQPQGSRTSS